MGKCSRSRGKPQNFWMILTNWWLAMHACYQWQRIWGWRYTHEWPTTGLLVSTVGAERHHWHIAETCHIGAVWFIFICLWNLDLSVDSSTSCTSAMHHITQLWGMCIIGKEGQKFCNRALAVLMYIVKSLTVVMELRQRWYEFKLTIQLECNKKHFIDCHCLTVDNTCVSVK